MIEVYPVDEVGKHKLIYLTQWVGEHDLPTLVKFQDQVLKDPERTALIIQNDNVFALAVNKVSHGKVL